MESDVSKDAQVLLGNSQLSEGRTKDAVQNLEVAIGGLGNDCG